jgi:hypothetical protein
MRAARDAIVFIKTSVVCPEEDNNAKDEPRAMKLNIFTFR